MSFLKQINKTARQVAKFGLSKIGITLSDVEVPEDPDLEERDLFDFFSDTFDTRKKGQPLPAIPQNLQQNALAWATPFCGENHELCQKIADFLKQPENFTRRDIQNPDSIQAELIELLKLHQVVQTMPDTPADTLAALQKIAVAQKRKCCNLLRQASAQIDTDDTQTWLDEMNSRLQRFDLKITSAPLLSIHTTA